MQSRLDGGGEIDGSSRMSRAVTPSVPPGHAVRERTVAAAELGACRNSCSEVPLIGCQQSAPPTRRLPQSIGLSGVPDEHGRWDPRSRAPFSHSEPCIEGDKSETAGVSLPDGTDALAGDVEQGARSWAMHLLG